MPDACVQVKNVRCFKHPLQSNLRESKRTMQLGRYSTIQVATQEHFNGGDGNASETAAPQHEAGLDEPPVLEQAAEAHLTDKRHAGNAQDQPEADAEGTGEEAGNGAAPRLSGGAQALHGAAALLARQWGLDNHLAQTAAAPAAAPAVSPQAARSRSSSADEPVEEGSRDEDALEDEDSLEDEDPLAFSDAEGDVGAC